MLRWFCVSLLPLALYLSSSFAANTHGTPSTQQEMQEWFGDTLTPFAVTGCLPATSGTTTTPAFTCKGYVRGASGELVYVEQPSKAVGPLNAGDGVYWVSIHRDVSTAVSGWTRQAGTHYLWRQSATLPAEPSSGAIMARVTVAGGAITVIGDRRRSLSVAQSGICNVKDQLFGGTGNGTTDDTPAITLALANQHCGVIGFPHGVYRVTSTLTVAKGVTFQGLGAGPGGATSKGNLTYPGAALEHDFSGTFFNLAGTAGEVETGVGVVFQNLILRQVYGNNSAAAGIAINVVATSNTFFASWVRVLNVTIEKDSARDDWTWGIVLDGEATTGTALVGSRDHVIDHLRMTTGPNSTGGIKLRSTANIHIANIIINGNAGHIDIGGTPADRPAYTTFMSNIQAIGNLVLARVSTLLCSSCSFDALSASALTSNVVYSGVLSGIPTIAAGATAVTVQLGAAFYTGGTTALTISPEDVGQAQINLDSAGVSSGYISFLTDGTSLWQLGRAGTTGTFFLHGPGAVSNVLTGTLAGGMSFGYAMTRKHRTLTYSSPVSVDAAQGNVFNLSVTDASNFTINAPIGTGVLPGQEISFRIFNSSGGAMGTITWQPTYHLAGAFVNPANGYNRTITFLAQDAQGGLLFESNRTAADVSN